MKTELLPALLDTPQGQQADRILRSCVHCGFCTATCPTYQLLGDELDGPRGRIYQIKSLLEGKATDRTAQHAIQQHLDRCLSCRSCETTCPSGVQYGRLLEIGRGMIQQQLHRPLWQRLHRKALLALITRPHLLTAIYALARPLRPLFPKALRGSIPSVYPLESASTASASRHNTQAATKPRVLLLDGCVQSAATPQTNQAARQLLAQLGFEVLSQPRSSCCGAAELHTDAHDAALQRMRRNCDQWLAVADGHASESGAPVHAPPVTAIISTASGCGVTVKDYGELLQHDADYAAKARRLSDLTQDIAEFVAKQDLSALAPTLAGKLTVAYHPPCTLQHGQALPGVVEGILDTLGFQRSQVDNPHLCCGSAGTYSIFQPKLSSQLLNNKLAALQRPEAQCIATANIGCQLHLAGGSHLPVVHWLELLTRDSIPLSQ